MKHPIESTYSIYLKYCLYAMRCVIALRLNMVSILLQNVVKTVIFTARIASRAMSWDCPRHADGYVNAHVTLHCSGTQDFAWSA